MNEAKLRGAMGFAMRAGKCIAGDFACERAVKRGNARLVLLDTAASAATQERYSGLCERAGIPCVDVGLPLKCMHTCAEVIDLADSDALASLVCEFVCSEEIAEVFAR